MVLEHFLVEVDDLDPLIIEKETMFPHIFRGALMNIEKADDKHLSVHACCNLTDLCFSKSW